MGEQATEFGQHLRRLRAAAGLTQEELAARAGISPKSIAALERGRRQQPYPATVRALAQALGLSETDRFLLMSSIGARQEQRDRAPAAPAAAPQPPAALAAPPLLPSKLYLPQPGAGLVRRPRLYAKLARGVAGPLTIVAAPAGFGKTTLLADWLAAHSPELGATHSSQLAAQKYHTAWLSLDRAESSLVEFLRYLVAALQALAPAIGRTVLPLLQSAQPPPSEILLSLLVADLIALPEPSLLVLDDYHTIDAPAVHHALAFLVEQLPPQLHLIIASRSDPPLPLARLRARRQLTELRANDLRFTPEETATFLREAMELPIASEDVLALEARTEGWIVGLQLAALSLRDRPDAQRAAFIESFMGSHRFIIDYLVDEVLAGQPAHLQVFLLQTSFLERMCGPLCDAVVLGGEPQARATAQNAYSQLLLEQLERSNLFIVPLDETRHWYRYHHLFAQVLRHRLLSGASPDAVAALHTRAGAWFERHGLIDDAVRQAFAGSDLRRVAELIERHGMALLERSEEPVVRRWIEQLPPELVESRPRLAIVAAWLLASLYRFEALERLLEAALAPAAAPIPADILGEAAVLRATVARVSEQYGSAIELAREALALLPTSAAAMRARAIITIGVCQMYTGDTSAAEAAMLEAAALAQATGSAANSLIATYWLSTLYDRQGRLSDKLRVCEQALTASGASQAALPLMGAAHIGIGDIWYERNQLARAQPSVAAALRLLGSSMEQYFVCSAHVLQAHIAQARGDEQAALRSLDEGDAWAVRMRIENQQFHQMLAAHRARIWLRQGKLAEALGWAATCSFDDERRLSHVRRFTWIRVRLAHSRQVPDQEALAGLASLVARLLAMAEEQRWVRIQIELLMLQALIFQAQGDQSQALSVLAQALTRAAPEGYLRLFVDEGAPMAALLRAAQRAGVAREYAGALLAAFPPDSAPADEPAAGQPLPEPLSEREREVLRLLARGCSNQAIARELIVAVGTVKRHVSNIMGKLGAASRLEAVARARSLGLD